MTPADSPQRRRKSDRQPERAGKVPEELTDASRGTRLQKVLAEAGVASRRDCEQYILEGRVSVNGKPVTGLPAWVDPAQDRIEVDGQRIRHPSQHRKEQIGHVYVMLNKPRGTITTTSDELGRRSVVDLVQLPPNLPQRLFPVGRLDADSSGLILLTNDGDLAEKLTHPRYEVAKQYHVAIRGRLTAEQVQDLKEGMYLAQTPRRAAGPRPSGARRAAMSDVKLVGYGRDRNANERTTLLVTLQEGQNREIRRMIARLGHKVRRLRRIAIGPLELKGLGVGEWRLLTPREITALRRSAGPGDAPRPSPRRSTGPRRELSPRRDRAPRREAGPRPPKRRTP